MYFTLSLVLGVLLFSSCSSRVSRCENEVKSYRHGDTARVDDKSFPIGPYTQNKEAARLLLDRAVIRLQQGEAKESLNDMCTAIDAIDYYRGTLVQEKAMQLLVDDQQSAYIAKPYESLFARLYAAFACYELGQKDDAFVFLKQAMAQEDLRNEQEGTKERSPLLAYLMALHLERQKDYSQAALFYKRAYDACPLHFIEQDLERVSGLIETRKATILFIVHEGLIPEKVSVIAPASVVSAVAVEALLAGCNVPPAVSSLTGIALPAFPDRCCSHRTPVISVDQKQYSPQKIEDLFITAKRQLDEEIPKLAAQAAARQLIRRAAVGAVREQHPLAGDIADIFAFAANLATKADTRMWKTLPRSIYLYRMDVSPGTYRVGDTKISLKSGDLHVQQLFHHHS